MKFLYVFVLLALCRSAAGSIKGMKRLYSDMFGNYSRKLRPLYNQSQHVDVHSRFNLVTITEVDQVRQILHSNVWMNLTWWDEFLTWNPEDYSGIKSIHPPLTDIWRPKLIVPVSVEDRDVFKDETASITVNSDGRVTWFPGANFVTDCKLDLTLFPFDVQTCQFRFLPTSYNSNELKMVSSLISANTQSYTENGEWSISASRAYTTERTFVDSTFSFLYVDIDLERRPMFFVLNVILPVVVLSFLNIFVFSLPCDCGEKVSYAITCLLSLTVFMSIVSGLLPKSSDNIPMVTVYLTCLLGISVLSVVATIFIVMKDPAKVNKKKTQSPLFVIPRFCLLRFLGSRRKVMDEVQLDCKTNGWAGNGNPTGKVLEGQGISGGYCVTADSLCMVIFTVLWMVVSVGFLIQITQ
ncbi:neuronal acetylcholine receptor subunit alpha-6-like [Haliotis rubra]|uniref:neuronal acetylcholine receptor subunit alpha-6-like n=1 Tax=Haliotis rubra TaxID=36100 RepID=UPI001EE5A3BC|nr:neuronal acetylcholine receptor subunit alpha-6-like [Haliotis rubra]